MFREDPISRKAAALAEALDDAILPHKPLSPVSPALGWMACRTTGWGAFLGLAAFLRLALWPVLRGRRARRP